MTDADYILLALHEAQEAASAGEVPIGAVLVKDGQVVAKSGNRKEQTKLSTRHAELELLEQGMSAYGKYLYDCTLYVTLEPCAMCAGAMINARLGRLVFGAYDRKAGCAGSVYDLLGDGKFNHRVEVTGGVCESECAEILSTFFANKRGVKC